MRTSRASAGFTLIELLVVIGVIAIIAAAAVPAVESLSGANARKGAGALAGAMRHLHDAARLRHATCRLALDLDGRAWWAECASGRVGLSRDPEREETERELADRFPDEGSEERRLLARTKFGAFEDRLVRKVELPGNVRFGEVRLEGRRGALEEGTAYVHFFPGGRAQRAVVPLVDGDNVYTIVLAPLTGRTRVAYGPVDVEMEE